MKLCVIHPSSVGYSARKLAAAIGAVPINPYETDRTNFRQYDLVFNLGISWEDVSAKKFINHPASVAKCVNKITTFKAFHAAKLPTVEFATRWEDVPRSWETVVCRIDARAAKGEGMDYAYRDAKGRIKLPEVELYTNYYEHDFEFRIVVFNGKIVARYIKEEDEGMWAFNPVEKTGFNRIDEACLAAAKTLGIDYVGFDVVAVHQEDFRILEANSGATLTDDVIKAIKKQLKGMI